MDFPQEILIVDNELILFTFKSLTSAISSFFSGLVQIRSWKDVIAPGFNVFLRTIKHIGFLDLAPTLQNFNAGGVYREAWSKPGALRPRKLYDREQRVLIDGRTDNLPYDIVSHVWRPEADRVGICCPLLPEGHWPQSALTLSEFEEVEQVLSSLHLEASRYVWLDFLCLEPTRDAAYMEELLNMASYYAQASTCYVFTDGLTYKRQYDGSSDNPPGPFVWAERVWTLQEALLSGSMQFIVWKDGKLIHSPASKGTIHEIIENWDTFTQNFPPTLTNEQITQRRHALAQLHYLLTMTQKMQSFSFTDTIEMLMTRHSTLLEDFGYAAMAFVPNAPTNQPTFHIPQSCTTRVQVLTHLLETLQSSELISLALSGGTRSQSLADPTRLSWLPSCTDASWSRPLTRFTRNEVQTNNMTVIYTPHGLNITKYRVLHPTPHTTTSYKAVNAPTAAFHFQSAAWTHGKGGILTKDVMKTPVGRAMHGCTCAVCHNLFKEQDPARDPGGQVLRELRLLHEKDVLMPGGFDPGVMDGDVRYLVLAHGTLERRRDIIDKDDPDSESNVLIEVRDGEDLTCCRGLMVRKRGAGNSCKEGGAEFDVVGTFSYVGLQNVVPGEGACFVYS
ncbi:hypothetical protein HK097_008019 [Rhizophlyctis rosea]|uniref:Heterokaryon incompatibility domain-containing protein n=1 Tax=Rhizophlyctis rosea TaxID=64517 RepID=A0AAD5X5J5_9FUNG|nr:hypothetical protein HK097_008019 [Rhizophlyctis rosea]